MFTLGDWVVEFFVLFFYLHWPLQSPSRFIGKTVTVKTKEGIELSDKLFSRDKSTRNVILSFDGGYSVVRGNQVRFIATEKEKVQFVTLFGKPYIFSCTNR